MVCGSPFINLGPFFFQLHSLFNMPTSDSNSKLNLTINFRSSHPHNDVLKAIGTIKVLLTAEREKVSIQY